jgi:gamma-butyrobetaine dioxygenase
LFSLDAAGKLSQVGYSDEFRDRHMPLEPKNMKAFYKAYIRFTQLLLDNKSSFWYKMKNGDGISVNNHRVLHARNGYEDSTDNNRVFQLAYMDWDCVHSKIRILSEQQGIPSPV